MSTLLQMSGEALLGSLLRTSWQVALLVLAVLILQRLFAKQLSPRWRYGLWCIVLVRAAMFPMAPLPAGSLASPLAWSPGGSSPSHTTASWEQAQAQPGKQTPASTLGPGAIARARPNIAGPLPPQAAPRVSASTTPLRTFFPEPAPAELVAPEPRAALATTSTPTGGQTPWHLVALGIWLTGATLRLVHLVLSERRFRSRYRDLPEVTTGRVQAALAKAAQTAGLARPPVMLQASFASGPAVTGILRPTLLVPPAFGDDLDDQALSHVLLHETFHLRHGDVLANAGLCLLRALFWFHPLVLFAVARMVASRESLRDWQALSVSQTGRPETYAQTLIHLASAPGRATCPPLTAPLFLPFLRRRPDLERRILMITRFDQASHKSWTAGAIACVGIGWLAFTAPSAAGVLPAATPEVVENLTLQSEVAEPQGTPKVGMRIERLSPEADWHKALRLALETTVEFEAVDTSLIEYLKHTAKSVGVNLTITPEAAEELEAKHDLSVSAPAADTFDRILGLNGGELYWTLAHRSVIVGHPYDVPLPTDSRIYNMEPFWERGFQIDEVFDLMTEMSVRGVYMWDRPGASIEQIGHLLKVRADYRCHEETERLLKRLLHVDSTKEAELTKSVLPGLDEIMVDVNFKDQSLDAVIKWLATNSRLPVSYNPDSVDPDLTFSFDLNQVSMLDMVNLVALRSDATVEEADGDLIIGSFEDAETVFGFYNLEALTVIDVLGFYDDPVYNIETIVQEVLKDSGELYGADSSIGTINGILVVKVTPTGHAETVQVLEALAKLGE